MTNSGCATTDCDRKHYARGWCQRHYNQALTAGALESRPRSLVARGASLEDRLRHIGWDVTPAGCWEWRGSLNPGGYGQLAGGGPRPYLAHRVSFEVFTGERLGDRMACHKCDNRKCINPAHIFPGTNADNARDMSVKRRNPAGEYRPDAKLSSDDIARIKSRYAAGGIRQRDLADEYGVCQQLVSMIINQKRRSAPARPSALSS